MLFIWVEKEYIYDIVVHLETMNFFYVENVCYVMIDPVMEKGKFLIVHFDSNYFTCYLTFLHKFIMCNYLVYR